MSKAAQRRKMDTTPPEVLYRWEWRASDGTYEVFDWQQCIMLETSCRHEGCSETAT